MRVRRKLLPLIVALSVGGGLMMFRPLFAQAIPPGVLAQAAETEDASEAAPQQTPASLPHGKFWLDYLIVAALLAGTLYAVCRSSRRV